MDRDLSLTTVLMAIYTAAGNKVDEPVSDFAWIASLPLSIRKTADRYVTELASMRCVRLEQASTAVTASGLAWLQATQWDERKVA